MYFFKSVLEKYTWEALLRGRENSNIIIYKLDEIGSSTAMT